MNPARIPAMLVKTGSLTWVGFASPGGGQMETYNSATPDNARTPANVYTIVSHIRSVTTWLGFPTTSFWSLAGRSRKVLMAMSFLSSVERPWTDFVTKSFLTSDGRVSAAWVAISFLSSVGRLRVASWATSFLMSGGRVWVASVTTSFLAEVG